MSHKSLMKGDRNTQSTVQLWGKRYGNILVLIYRTKFYVKSHITTFGTDTVLPTHVGHLMTSGRIL